MSIISRSRPLLVISLLTTALGLASCTPAQLREVEAAHAAPAVRTPAVRIAPAASDFLRFAQALHNEPFLACTRAHESDTAGGYQAYNPQGPYYGAYQYLQHTWNTAAVNYGNYLPQFVGVPPTQVPGFFQDSVTWHFYLAVGNGPWAGRC